MENEEKPPLVPDGDQADQLRQLLELGLDETMVDDEADQEGPQNQSIQALQFGDYEVIEELGRGGMGVVYKARQRSLNRVVALKMILATKFASEVQRLRFFREAELIASLRHPNIVSIHEIGEHEGQPYYSMDFIEGTSLKDLIQTDPLPWPEATRFAQVIAQAMQAAHERGVIHRDLKPHNILLDHLRHLHVADFGLARDLNTDHGLTMTGAVLGTPNYMSPEQSSGDDLITVGTDVYAIGAILYEMLTTLPPFLGGSLAEILEKVRNAEPLAPKLINRSIPRDLNTVCLKCLEKDPARRYQNAAELAEELDCVLRDIPIKAKPIGPLEHGWRWCRRNRNLAAVLLGSAALLFGGTILSYRLILNQRDQAVSARDLAQRSASDAEAQRQLAVQANAATQQKNTELEKALDEIKQQKGIIADTKESIAQRDLDQAKESFRQLHPEDSQHLVRQILSDHPDMAGAWYLKGELALARLDLAEAKSSILKAQSLDAKSLGPDGTGLLGLASKYLDFASGASNGKLTASDTLSLLRDLQGKPEYGPFVQNQEKLRQSLADVLRQVIAAANQGKVPTEDQVHVLAEGDGVTLELRNLPGEIDLSDARNFPVFTSLRIINCGLTNLAFVRGLKLISVDIEQTPVAQIDPLKDSALQSLILRDTKVTDLSALEAVPLVTLQLQGVPCPTNELLAKWSLNTLSIEGVNLPRSFVVPNAVRHLSVAKTGLSSLQQVAMTGLITLDVSGNPVESLEPLRNMINLRSLDISDTEVTTIAPLSGLNLEVLALRNSHVGQLAGLSRVPVQELDIRGTYIMDLDKLPNKPGKILSDKTAVH